MLSVGSKQYLYDKLQHRDESSRGDNGISSDPSDPTDNNWITECNSRGVQATFRGATAIATRYGLQHYLRFQ